MSRGKTAKILGMLAALALSAGVGGCSLPDDIPVLDRITQPVEEVVSSVKQNMELREQMDALDLPKDVDSISGGRYAYESLTEEGRVVYDQMLDAILNQDEEVTLSTSSGSWLEEIFDCIKADYGGLFWVESFHYTQYQRNGETELLAFAPNYTMDRDRRDELQEKIDRQVKKYLKDLPADATDYDKVRHVYQKLIRKVDYNLEAENNQNIISVFLGRETVCQGYANAMQYLLDELDIPCMIVTGTANGGPHAWNLVQLDGDWYYVDVTWGNSAYHDEEENDVKYVEYDYLNITSKELFLDHHPKMSFELPECTAVKNNYYVQEDRYFTDLDEKSIERIGVILKRAYEKGKRNISVKFSDKALCSQAKQYFLSDYHIQDYCSGLESVYYNTDSQMNIFTIIFP